MARPADTDSLRRVTLLATVSIAVGLTVLGLKYVAFAVTGSVALFSDAIESIANVATALAALAAIRISAKPADANHPYGHSKAEYFSAVFEGVLIIGAALAILYGAWRGFSHPRAPDAPALGLAINGVSTAMNAAWGVVLIRQGRALRSPALAADGRHLITDLYTSIGVFVGVVLIAFTGWTILDPIIAAVVALNVIWSGWRLTRESVGGLMDIALPDADLAKLQAIVAENMTGAIEAHDIRTRHAGRLIFIDFHLIVDGSLSVNAAHDICDRIEGALLAEFEDAVISIHVEPPHKLREDGGVHLMIGEETVAA